MNFIKWLNNYLDELDNFNISNICKTFHLPNIFPNNYWFLVKKLHSVKEINYKRYLSSLLDRSLEDNSSFKKNITYYNHFININTPSELPFSETLSSALPSETSSLSLCSSVA